MVGFRHSAVNIAAQAWQVHMLEATGGSGTLQALRACPAQASRPLGAQDQGAETETHQDSFFVMR